MCSGLSCLGQTRPNYSGTWALNLKKSGEVPAPLKSYTLTVKQDEQQITLDAKVEGDINPNAPDQGTTPVQAIPLATTTANLNSGNTDEGGAAVSHKIVVAISRALALVIRHLNCTLDGKETSREIGGMTPGMIKSKAHWMKGNKGLEINLAREIDVQGSKFTSMVREQWQISEDGKTLKIKRTVNLMAGYDETMLTFVRQ
jgi:hypothetical protein